MADQEQIKILRTGSASWNEWRRGSNFSPNLAGANLNRLDLRNADLRGAIMTGARLEQADLTNADLTGAQLQKAFLVEANLTNATLREVALSGADLGASNLSGANLEEAVLDAADLSGANLLKTNFRNADLTLSRFRWSELNRTIFNGAVFDGTLVSDCNLSFALGLDDCEHFGPSVIDHLTLEQSGPLPVPFLKGIGLPDDLIALLPNIFGKQTDYHSCFISYSALDHKFATRLHRSLQDAGIRCWFAPHDMPIGGKILDRGGPTS